MFDLNRWPIIQRIGRRFRSNMYIPVYHTNGRSIKNMIGVVKNRLVGMGLEAVSSVLVQCIVLLVLVLAKVNEQ